MTIIAGEFDLSVGSAAAVAGIVAVSVVEDIGLIPAVLAHHAIGAAYGAVQGYLVHRLKIQSLVFTLGTLIALRGVAFMISGENTVVMADLAIAKSVRRQLWIFSPFSLVTIAGLRRHRSVPLGTCESDERSMPSVEGVRKLPPLASPSCDRSSSPSRLSGSLAALTGALTSIKSGSAGPAAFEELLLPAVTAALIGGVSLFGGKGSVVGIAIGALTLRFLISGLSLEGAPFYVLTLATGAVLIVVVVLELVIGPHELRARWQRWRNRRRHLAGAVPP